MTDTTTTPVAQATRPRAGAEATRARIVEAALQALRDEGIAGISARGIARHGGFNQALIFYHFGSVEGLLVAVAQRESERTAEPARSDALIRREDMSAKAVKPQQEVEHRVRRP